MNAVMTVYCSDHQGDTCKACNDYLVPVHKSLMNIVHVLNAWPALVHAVIIMNKIISLRWGFQIAKIEKMHPLIALKGT